MIIMFKTNNINVTKDELKSLFFKKDQILQDDELYLDFNQFMEFALNKICDQDFRLFMRKLKTKTKEKANRLSIIELDVENESQFLPMNFNLLLDYFNNKGKHRINVSKIQDAIEIMNKIIDKGIEFNLTEANNNNKNEKESNDEEENEKEKEKKKEKEKEEILKLHDNIDFRILFEEFYKIFDQKPYTFNDNNSNNDKNSLNNKNIIKDKSTIFPLMEKIDKEIDKENENDNDKEIDKIKINNLNLPKENKKQRIKTATLPSKINNNNKNSKNEEILFNTMPNNNFFNTQNSFFTYNNNQYDIKDENLVFTNYLKDKLNKFNVMQKNLENYEKFKSVKLAINETNKAYNNKSDYSINSANQTKSTGFSYKPNIDINKSKLNEIYKKNNKDKFDILNMKNNDKNKVKEKSNGNLKANKMDFQNHTRNFFNENNEFRKKLIPDSQSDQNNKDKILNIKDDKNNYNENNHCKFHSFMLPILNNEDNSVSVLQKDYIPNKFLNEIFNKY